MYFLGVLLISYGWAGVIAQSVLPIMPSYFFLCNYHGDQDQSNLNTGEVSISVNIAGNPEFYKPTEIYDVTITSSRDFDGFQLTGLYTMPSSEMFHFPRNNMPSLGFGADRPFGSNFLCSLVATHHDPLPRHRLTFKWRAPQAGTGCISFRASATLGNEVLFKDVTVLQLCEEGDPEATPLRPSLAGIHENGVIFRDDFDSHKDLNNLLWSSMEGGEVGSKCGVISHGRAAVFCRNDVFRSMVTVPLNLTTASVLQFSIGSGSCSATGLDKSIILGYGTEGCHKWTGLESIRSPYMQKTQVHLVHLPPGARSEGVCLRWQQEIPEWDSGHQDCWGLDNVLVVSVADPPHLLEDSFDPVDLPNWLFFPGGRIRHKCHSDQKALVFHNSDPVPTYVTTRDLNLEQEHMVFLLNHSFDGEPLTGWEINGGQRGDACGTAHKKQSLFFIEPAKTRSVCTPYTDLSEAGSIQFYLISGMVGCELSKYTVSSLYVYLEDADKHSTMLTTLELAKYKKPKKVSLPIRPQHRYHSARLCWAQKKHQGQSHDVWALDAVAVLHVVPVNASQFVQFTLNARCGTIHANTSVILEYSTDHGEDWYPMYEPCFTEVCPGQLQSTSSTFKATEIDGWARLTLPVPYSAMGHFTRLRWRQVEQGVPSNWAVDNVFIGPCEQGCNGHGFCSAEGCQCDFGYSGPSCGDSIRPLPTSMIENMSSISEITSNFELVKGAILNFDCGVVASGKAVVFHKDGLREIQTKDLNTTNTRYLQFSIRVGSGSHVGACPPPDRPEESVLLQYTCSGGIHWNLLKELTPKDFLQPRMVSVHLPPEAQEDVCRFRWWQPVHSGNGKDIWAVDDISVTGRMYNTINLDFHEPAEVTQAMEVHLGELGMYCGRYDALRFTNSEADGQPRYAQTNSMLIAPSYLLQFDLVIGCNQFYKPSLENKVYLEYSTDHGMTWALVHKGCWPPMMCEEYRPGTVYHASQYPTWTRIALPLPPHTWSGSSRFRWIQPKWHPADSWAITNVYIGQQCPELCHGHGSCNQGACKCDKGYHGDTCTPKMLLEEELKNDFSLIYDLDDDWSVIDGGKVVGSNEGCGSMLSGESLYFAKAGPRQLVTRDLNTSRADFVQFYVQIGGNGLKCSGADSRAENLLVQYSNNGGITWHLLKELHHEDYFTPKFAHIKLPPKARTPSTRIHWWQPTHSGPNVDQWAIDEVTIGRFEDMDFVQDNFELADPADGPALDYIWLTVTEGMYASYCQSKDDTLMFANQKNDKFAMTKDLNLQPGDVIQFRINVACSRIFSYYHPVLLQYSHDAGMSWRLVTKPCYVEDQCAGGYHEGSVYHAGAYGEWRLVVIPVTEEIAKGKVNFRWWQRGGLASSFALDDVYIGPPCPYMCSGRGTCAKGECKCDSGFQGAGCEDNGKTEPHGMIDRFEDRNRPSGLWQSIIGGELSTGCGVIGDGNSLYFNGDGTREVKTIALNTTTLRMLQFVARIGSRENLPGCAKPRSRNEAVIVDYSTDNGITWHVLKILDPDTLSDSPQTVHLSLPEEAKTGATVIRWWQPSTELGSPRAEWAIDDVVIAVNESSSFGFQDNFDPIKEDIWFMSMNAIPKFTCDSRSNALEFSKNGGQMRYAETWDYAVTSSTFLQFDLAMGCSGTYSTLYDIKLQYSLDMGAHWLPVQEECLPPRRDCSAYHLSSSFVSESHSNWTRVTLYLPPHAVSSATRFRWLQDTVTLRGNVWALDNVYLGEGCPWMCSGHGYCKSGVCVCDVGFTGEFCVPSKPLPTGMKYDFENELPQSDWPEVYGAETTNICGLLVSGKSLTFLKDNLRLASTKDLDLSMAMHLQFLFQYGCQYHDIEWPREHSILVQYSTNGGIWWNLLKEIHYKTEGTPKFFSVNLPTPSQTNATRIRFWQPQHDGRMQSVWMLDNMLIGGSMLLQDMLYETFDGAPRPEDWLFWPGGTVDKFCTYNTREDTIMAGPSAMTFQYGPGERSITTRDLNVNELTVLQFDLNMGCNSHSTHLHPVKLEYSMDGGQTWQTVVPPCEEDSAVLCMQRSRDPTVYYSGTSQYWRRFTVPLSGRQICGLARFRWYQGFFNNKDFVPDWALDNVYIGMQCHQHCLGHGSCMNGMLCQCDVDHHGDICVLERKINPTYLKDDFDTNTISQIDERKWHLLAGGERTEKCGILLSEFSMHFTGTGDRLITTVDLDLTVASFVQFFIKLGCTSLSPMVRAQPVLLQYSTNGGIIWETLQHFDYDASNVDPQYVALELPELARTNSTRIRWWQPSVNGTFLDDWAIDQVFIGGDINGRPFLQDDLSSTDTPNWLMYPGSVVEPVCGSPVNSLHFSGHGSARYAVTAGVMVLESTYIQFHIAMGCTRSGRCFNVDLEYSLDLGHTWKPVEAECLPSDIDCAHYRWSSTYSSDVYSGWNRVTFPLPYYTRSKATRFRWIQQDGYNMKDSWAVTQIYIGDECLCSCNGHGVCDRGTCKCDDGWKAEDCTVPVKPLKTLLSDSFSRELKDTNWDRVNGGEISTQCGVLAAGPSLHFKGPCTRQLITTDLDLQTAMFVQFSFMFGCISPPSHRDESVLLEYSTNGDTQWHHMIELYFDQYFKPSLIMVELPSEAKVNGARLRWWQPKHGGASKSDWALDNIVVGGKVINPGELQDSFNTDMNYIKWIQADNTDIKSYCGSEYALRGEATSKENVTLSTADMNIDKGYILQFSISVGCNGSNGDDIPPVHLQYSTDYGMSWEHLVKECLPFHRSCEGQAQMASLYYASPGWRRITIPLMGEEVSRATRFRWHQFSDQPLKFPNQWAIDDVYIGPACPDMCYGHGECRNRECICDKGYTGYNCYLATPNKPYIKDTFEHGYVDVHHWSLVQGGSIGNGCVTLVEGAGLHLSGPGQRQAVTVDLDLRNARFVQYYALLGGKSTRKGCGTPKSRNESVILQFSTDGGISWQTLHVLDHKMYSEVPHWDYIPLPAAARSNTTRLRWWQLIQRGNNPTVGWTIDNVFIDGFEINPSQLSESFEAPVPDLAWEFHPHGHQKTSQCGKDDKSLAWPVGSGTRSLTTGQLIVQEQYMLQFKIMMGCGEQKEFQCNTDQPVWLEYNKSPLSDVWDLVYPLCLINSHEYNMECQPYKFHSGSIYTANQHPKWTRVTMQLPAKTFSANTRFRWIQQNTQKKAVHWAVDDIFIGEMCPELCNGRGDCVQGKCVCNKGYVGPACHVVRGRLPSRMVDGFEGGVLESHWVSVVGGGLGLGCGELLHGKTLYFNGCALRQAVTTEMDTSRVSKVMFILQIGSHEQSNSCNVDLSAGSRGIVLLEYTKNKGIDWFLVATHIPHEFLSPRRVAYGLPVGAQAPGVQFRWWQPDHGGAGKDQWAIDHVEVIMTRKEQMLRRDSGYRGGAVPNIWRKRVRPRGLQ